MSDRKKFLKGITSGYAYMAFSMIVALWMVPYVLKFLTKSEYGIFAIAGDLLGWLSVANLGVTSAFNSKSGHLLGRNNLYELNVLTNTTFFTQLASSILIAIIGTVVVNNPSIVFGNEDIYENINVVVMLIVIGFFIQYITQPLNSLLVADKQVYIDNYLRFGLLAIQTVLNIVLLNFGFKLMSLAISSLISNIIISVITWFRIKKSFPSIKFEIKYFQKDKLRNLLKHGIWFSIGGIAGILILRMDTFLIGKYVSLALVTSFVINNKLYQITDKLHGQIFNTLRPYLSQAFGAGNHDKLANLYNLMYISSFVVALVLGGGVYLIGQKFIGWWVGPEYYLGDTINILLYINFVVQVTVLPNRILLAATLYRNRFHSVTRIFEGISKLLLCLLLLNYFCVETILVVSIVTSLVFSNVILNYLTSELLKERFIIKLLPFLSITFLVGMIFTANMWIDGFLLISSILTAILIFNLSGKRNEVKIKMIYALVNKKV